MKMPRAETPIYAWSVEELPEVIKASDEVRIVHCQEAIHVYAKPNTRLKDILSLLHDFFPQQDVALFELMLNRKAEIPEEDESE